MGVPVLLPLRTCRVFVLLFLLPAFLLALLFVMETLHHLVDGLAVGAGLHPLLTGFFMLAVALRQQGFLLADRFVETVQEHPVIAQSYGAQAAATGGFKILCVLVTVAAQFIQFGLLCRQVLLALAKFLHLVLLTVMCHALDRLHASG